MVGGYVVLDIPNKLVKPALKASREFRGARPGLRYLVISKVNDDKVNYDKQGAVYRQGTDDAQLGDSFWPDQLCPAVAVEHSTFVAALHRAVAPPSVVARMAELCGKAKAEAVLASFVGFSEVPMLHLLARAYVTNEAEFVLSGHQWGDSLDGDFAQTTSVHEGHLPACTRFRGAALVAR